MNTSTDNSNRYKSIRIVNNGDSALSLIFEEPISEQLSAKIVSLGNQIRQELSTQITEVIPAYQSLTIGFELAKTSAETLRRTIGSLIMTPCPNDKRESKLIEIPVCYEAEFAPDMAYLEENCQLQAEEIIRRHSAPSYLVHMLGFSPGFLYLGGLDSKLYCPRKPVPTLRVKSGSVGIGGEQTGIYPQATPGGWQIIGRTPLKLFDPKADSLCLASPLDQIKFRPIDAKEFVLIKNSSKRRFK